jgi:hypothetical protein
MNLPSFQQVVKDTTRTFLRFPFVLLTAAVGTLAAIILIDHEGPPQATFLFNVLLAGLAGIPLLLGLALITEKLKWSRPMALGVQLLGVMLLAAYATTIPQDLPRSPEIYMLRQLLLLVALHLFVAFAPYTGTGEYNGFWHFNKALFLRLFAAGLFTIVLYAGLAIALAALDNLFGIDVPEKRYAELWFALIGLFTTWFFLAGIPEDLDRLEQVADYPKAIKIFAQYILFPLVLVYLVILYAYLFKIVIAWDWPQGWVSKLILGFSAAGIFALLLLYPVREQAENIWIRKVSGWFYILMVPLIIMLFPAVWRRISEYGITEGRYIAAALSVWLTGITIYFIFSKIKSIKIIPLSLCLLALIISCGPWGAFTVSEKSQINRLQALLIKNSILVNGIVQKTSTVVPAEDVKQISSIISYLHRIHGFDRIQPWFSEGLREDSPAKENRYKDPAFVTGLMGIKYMNIWYDPSAREFHFGVDLNQVIDVSDYDLMWRNQHVWINQVEKGNTSDWLSYRINSTLDTLVFILRDENTDTDSVQITLRPLVDSLMVNYGNINLNNIPPENMSLTVSGPILKLKIYLRYLNLYREEKKVKINDYIMDILYGAKD